MEDIGAELVRHPNTRFLEKPYTSQRLAQTVRQILDATPVEVEVTSPC
jgi:hypothetical protein